MKDKLEARQDGNEFYDVRTGECVWKSTRVHGDYDLRGAELAREDFLNGRPEYTMERGLG